MKSRVLDNIWKHKTGFILLFLISLLNANLSAQITSSQIVQSTFYDAVNFYYAMAGSNAYPVYLGSRNYISKTQTKKTNTSPGVKTKKEGSNQIPDETETKNDTKNDTVERWYRIIESETGKVLLDTLKILVIIQNDGNKTTTPNLIEYLKKNYPDVDSSLYKQLKHNFGIDNETSNTYFYENGEFIKLNYLNNKESSLDGKSSTINITTKSEGLLSLPIIAEGLAEFYIEQVNSEINDAFFIHFQKILNEHPEFKILFPRTIASLNKIEVTNYSQSLNVIKTAYQTDIKNILSNISKLTALPKYQNLINKYPELILLFASCDFIYTIREGKSPAEILLEINNSDYIQKTTINNYNSSIKLAALISNSLINIKNGDASQSNVQWISLDQLNSLKNNSDLFKIFMGLMAQNAKKIEFKIGKSETKNLYKLLIDNKKEVLEGRYIVYNFFKTKDNISERIGLFKSQSSSEQQNISSKMDVSVDIMRELINFSEIGLNILPTNRETESLRDTLKLIKNKFIPLLQQTSSVIYNIENRQYSNAIYETDTLINFIVKLKQKGNNTEIERNNQEYSRNKDLMASNLDTQKQKNNVLRLNYSDSLKSINKSLKAKNVGIIAENDSLSTIRKEFLHYGLFISAVAEAQKPSDIKEAIKTFALPTGSSRIKKELRFSVGLNSYVGFYHAWNTQYPNLKLPKTENGLTAPLGLAVNLGWNKAGSLTAYLGIIDIGAIFTYKVANDSSTVKSDINFSQILSPSISLIYGFPIIKKYNIPLSIGIISSQWGPRLRKVSETGNSILPILTQRLSIFLAIDIPIINFYTKPK